MADKQGKTQTFVTVQREDLDAYGRLRPSMFMHYSELCASLDTVRAGFDQKVLAGHGYAWILARLHIKMVRPAPREGDSIVCKSWYKDYDGIFFPRFYEMDDADGNCIALAVGDWLILDRDKREMVRKPVGLEKLPYVESDEDCPMPMGVSKVVVPKSMEMEPAAEFAVTENEIDIVGHTNNAYYMKWAMESIPAEVASCHVIREATLNFLKETRLGEVVKVSRSVGKCDNGYICYLVFTSGENQVFKAVLSFE